MALEPRNRWPRVTLPADMPPKVKCKGFPLRVATIQRIGRMKRAPSRPVQVIERGQVRSWIARGRISPSICSAVRPRFAWRRDIRLLAFG